MQWQSAAPTAAGNQEPHQEATMATSGAGTKEDGQIMESMSKQPH